MAPAMPCKTCKKSEKGETWSKTNDFKSKIACIFETSGSTRMRMEESLPNYHEDHIAERGNISLQHCGLVHKFVAVPQAMKIPAAKSAVDKEWEKLEKIPAWDLTKVRSKKEVIDWSKDEGRKSSFCLTDGHLSFEECRIGGKAPKIQGSSCTPRWYCERRFWILCTMYRTRIISITNDCSKSHGCHLQIARLRWASSWRSICLYPGQNGRCSKIIENSQIEMSRHLDSSTTTQMAKIMVQYGRPSRSSWAKSVWSSFGRTVMGKAIWENSIENTVGRRFPIGNAYSYTMKKGCSYLCMWMTSNWLERNKNQSDVESTQQRSWLGRTNIFPRSCVPWMYSTTVK